MRRMKTAGLGVLLLLVLAALVTSVGVVRRAEAHCQMPCGIYNDAARIGFIKEDATTIRKAMNQINELAKQDSAEARNQTIRWVFTKDEAASHIITVVSEYFLTQKVKPVAPNADGYDHYLKTLAVHHAVMVAAMKTKQNVDLKYADALDEAIAELAKCY